MSDRTGLFDVLQLEEFVSVELFQRLLPQLFARTKDFHTKTTEYVCNCYSDRPIYNPLQWNVKNEYELQ